MSARTDENPASLRALTARIRAVEDRLEILNLLAGLPLSSDVGDQNFQSAAYHEDCVMDRNDAGALIEGRQAIVAIIGGTEHQKAQAGGMVHFAALPFIRIEGDRATATGYLQIVVPIEAGTADLEGYGSASSLAIWRLTANQWDLERHDHGWSVIRRVIRSVPKSDYRSIVAGGFASLD